MTFLKPGPANTEKTLELAVAAAKERGIETIVVASNTGETALKLKNCGLNVVCVTHVDGFVKPGENEMPKAVRAELKAAGMEVLTTAHVLSGAERGISRQAGGMYPVEAVAFALRMLGQGTKVCVEISVMAADAGLVPYGKKIMAIGGTGCGADTAAVLTPAYASELFKTKVHEIICKPML